MKCNTINTTSDTNAIIRLNYRQVRDPANPPRGFKWKPVRWYKYLGVPISKLGIDVPTYMNTIRGRIFGQFINTTQFGNSNHLTMRQRIILYQSTVRSLMEYSMAVIDWQPKQITELERLQEMALRNLSGAPKSIPYETLRQALGVTSMIGRIYQTKLIFYSKLKTPQQARDLPSLSKEVFHSIQQKRPMRAADSQYIDLEAQINKICAELKRDSLNIGQLIKSSYKEDLKAHIIQTIQSWDRCRTRKVLSSQHKQEWKHERIQLASHPSDEMAEPSPIAKALTRWGSILPKPSRAYTPNGLDEKEEQVLQQVLMADNAIERWNKNQCCHCNTTKNFRLLNLHRLLQCPEPKIVERRRLIFRSIVTELDYFAAEANEQESIYSEMDYIRMYDAAYRGFIKKHADLRPVMSFLLGGTITEGSEADSIKTEAHRMLSTHLRLLITAVDFIGHRDTKWKQLNVNSTSFWEQLPKYPPQSNIHIATEDLKNGKIICRIKIQRPQQSVEESDITLINIRKWMISTAPHLLSNYAIGLGAAGTRTSYQKHRAKQYGKQVIKACQDGGITYVDGSIYKLQKGGSGIVRIGNITTKPIAAYMCSVQTADAQQAELTAIEKALDLMTQNTIQPQTKEYILCDCRNAVNYIQESFATPHKYRKTIQRIKELQWKLAKLEIITSVHWIPGHVDIRGNEYADLVAKEAAKSDADDQNQYTANKWMSCGFQKKPIWLDKVMKDCLI